MEMTYKVSDLKALVTESSNEFKAKLGNGVEDENKKVNDKAYKDAKTRAKDFDGGLSDEVGKEKPKYVKVDDNKTLLDYEPETVSDDQKKRIHAQVKGYSSEAEMNNKIEKQGDFSDNDNIYNGIKDMGQEMHANIAKFKRMGLTAREMPEDAFKKEELYESYDGFNMRNMINLIKETEAEAIPQKSINEDKNMKTVFFKKTSFLSENHMISRIPDEFKSEGQVFKMKDKLREQYIVEWRNNKAYVLNHENKNVVNEDLEKIKRLYNYSSQVSNTTRNGRLNENDENMSRMLDITRKINNL